MITSLLPGRWLQISRGQPGTQHRRARKGIAFVGCAAAVTGIALTTAGLAGGAAPAMAATQSLGPPSYNRVAPASATPTPAQAASPTHWWPADGSAADIVGHDNGRLFGVSYGPGGDGTGQAFSFTGAWGRRSNEVRFNKYGGNFGNSDFSVSFEFKTTSTRIQALWEKWPVCHAARFWSFRITGSGKLDFSIDNATGSQFVAIESGPGYNDGAWHQVIGTRHGATTSLYVDGVLTATGTGPHTVYLHNTVHMVAGESVCDGIDGTVPFTGEMGELMTYRSAITP
jgi:trimeric autotransporter adhesin